MMRGLKRSPQLSADVTAKRVVDQLSSAVNAFRAVEWSDVSSEVGAELAEVLRELRPVMTQTINQLERKAVAR